MGVMDDATAILLLLARHEQYPGDSKRGRYVLSGSEIASTLGLDADRINDAVELLRSRGNVDVPEVGGTAPYDFMYVELTASGRVDAEALHQADRSSRQRGRVVRESRLEQLAGFFRDLAGRIPRDSEPSQPWQDEAVQAVAECLDLSNDAFTPLVAHVVPVARVAAFKASLRKLRERAGRYSTAHNPEIQSALAVINDILAIVAQKPLDTTVADPDAEGPRPLRADQVDLIGLVARFLSGERTRFVQGLDIRSKMGGDRESKRARLQELVPHYLSLYGSAREDSYSLTPLGLLRSDLGQRATTLASDLRRFVLSVHSGGKDRFTWDELASAVSIEGRELRQEDLEFVDLVLLCIGVWGRSGTTWSKPRPEQLEDLLEIEDGELLFQRVNSALVAMNSVEAPGGGSRGEAVSLTVNNFNGPVGAVAAAPGAVADGRVAIHQLDNALRHVIERQDELGDLADVLLPLLRAARKLERRGISDDDLAAAVTEGEEFKEFEAALKPGVSRAAVTTARTILELVPLMKPVLKLLD